MVPSSPSAGVKLPRGNIVMNLIILFILYHGKEKNITVSSKNK